jgi:hypothetical protein
VLVRIALVYCTPLINTEKPPTAPTNADGNAAELVTVVLALVAVAVAVVDVLVFV